MNMQQYLVETFRFNDAANRAMIEKVKELPDPSNSIRHLSHLINSQIKWMARIQQDPQASRLSWWEPVYEYHQLVKAWEASLHPWLEMMSSISAEDIHREMLFVGKDEGWWSASLIDIALQLNYHSIHHRAQIQVFIREQGIEPEFIDYIGTRYVKRSLVVQSS